MFDLQFGSLFYVSFFFLSHSLARSFAHSFSVCCVCIVRYVLSNNTLIQLAVVICNDDDDDVGNEFGFGM